MRLNAGRRDTLPICVALDLETTGLDPAQDTIIEIGAVKFQGRQVLDTFETLVNPYREIPTEVRRLTGIGQGLVDKAPPFPALAEDLMDFVGPHLVVGHRIAFDLDFLSRQGLPFANEVFDTWDLASILLPHSTDYSLQTLARELGAEHSRPHRALPDAQATREIFLVMLEKASELDPATVSYIRHLASLAQWPEGRMLEQLVGHAVSNTSQMGLTGVDLDSLAKRLGRTDGTVRPTKNMEPLDAEQLAGHLAPGGLFSRKYSGFEHRPQQVEMMRAVAGAINSGEHMMVEGGTGVGKSLAYLLPAILYSLKNGARVVVSTNTINLQEQLLQKDIPALVKVLEEDGVIPAGQFRAASLKGRANYLCPRRWRRLAGGEGLSEDEARLLSKTLIWLQYTADGDRSEINLSWKDSGIWSRISAGDKGQCPGVRGEGPCFLRAARERADAAHILVVNHALLLSDLARGGGLLPEYQHLIIDEAHHLEEGATRQLGFLVSQGRLAEELETLGRLLGDARSALMRSGSSSVLTEQFEALAGDLDARWPRRTRASWDRLWDLVERFMDQHHEGGGDLYQLRIARSTRAQPGWSEVEIAWENLDVVLAEGVKGLERLQHFLDTLSLADQTIDEVIPEITTWLEGLGEMRDQLSSLITAPAEESRIEWIARGDDSSNRSDIVLHSAPLNVGAELDERLFSRKRSVILTSATLATQGNFDYFRQRVGVLEGAELAVGSPFDYRRAALLLIPEDMPPLDAWDYQRAMESILVGLVKALTGRVMVLYTSHASLRSAARAIRGPLEAEGIQVLAQGIDGSPRRIVRRFADNPKGVILGTSSFWEGVDLSGGVLKALVIARIPFHVPTEPIFAARSSEYEDPFHQYAIPQAVLRFRQGIGRLIRGSEDRGAVVILDKRIISRSYGRAFLDSAGNWTVRTEPLSAIPGSVSEWVRERS